MTDGQFFAVIPAGGSGTRLWPLSRSNRPKFLLPLPGPRTMIQETVHRLKPLVARENLYIITGSTHAAAIARQTPDVPEDQIIIEPSARGTGPAIGLGVALAALRDPDAIVGSFAADHVVEQPRVFVNAVRAAVEVAKNGYLVTIGITPTHPETGYGYIRSSTSIGNFKEVTAFNVADFREKPDYETATAWVESGEFLWNASMFVWSAKTLLDEMSSLLPNLHAALQRIVNDWDSPRRESTLADVWRTIDNVTIDHGILEHSEKVAVVPGDFGWSDIGDWHSVGDILKSDEEQNASVGCNLLAVDTHNALVYGNNRPVALVGVENLVVVDTPDALLVCNRSQAQSVRDVVDILRQRGSTELL